MHTLRGGETDFEEISAVVPWVELAADVPAMGRLDGEQGGLAPRVYKTHAWERDCPKGGRYIVCLRCPLDVAVSFYHFFEGWFFPPGAIGVDEAPAADRTRRPRVSSPPAHVWQQRPKCGMRAPNASGARPNTGPIPHTAPHPFLSS